MLTHLPRSAEVRRLYRKGLEPSREFPDPCGRNYLMRRVQEVAGNARARPSPTKIGRHVKEGRQSVRRMERALHGREDYARVTQLAYGAVGRVKHLLAAADAELDAHHLPERRNRNRPPKFSLPPLEGEARETFTLGLLLRKIEQLNPHASRDENEDVAEPDAEAVRRQLEALRDSVPPPLGGWRRRARKRPTAGFPGLGRRAREPTADALARVSRRRGLGDDARRASAHDVPADRRESFEGPSVVFRRRRGEREKELPPERFRRSASRPGFTHCESHGHGRRTRDADRKQRRKT